MIVAIALLVASSAVFIFTMAAPLCRWGEYSSTISYSLSDADVKSETTIKIKTRNKLLVKTKLTNLNTGETIDREGEAWYYRTGKTLFQIGDVEDMTKEEYKEAVQAIKDMSEEEYTAYKNESSYVITFKAFYLSNESSIRGSEYGNRIDKLYINKSKIPAVIVTSIIETITLAFAATAVILYIISKKNGSTVVPTTINTTNEQ